MAREYGEWNWAADSYGKVRHSNKACVYKTVLEEGGERIVKVAAQIPDWSEAKMIAAAPVMLRALKQAYQRSCERSESNVKWTMKDQNAHEALAAAIALAETGHH